MPQPATVFTLGHSPDPDDAFMFYAMAENKIDLRGYRFDHILQDIQTLNERATRGELHISAVSIHALAYVLDKYALLPSGASMGDGYGPLLVTLPKESGENAPAAAGSDHASIRRWLAGRTIAVPGRMTSAFLALRLFLEDTECDFHVVPFDRIFDAVRHGNADAGLLIHEGQLTYAAEGFSAVVDLGVWWKAATGLPLPLGGNVVRKDIDRPVRRELAQILADSIDYGLQHRADAVAHSMPLARGLDVPLADKFIGMYVNDFTRDYGATGRRAVHTFLSAASEAGLIPAPVDLEFVD
ncbi:MAG: ABC transporter substrate-binding protein [Verrucomicrobia bacterium]|nr:ABC transporter substrate-binding protein [Verrucomicrobiota bacterium]